MAARQVRLGNYIAYGSNDFLGAGAMSIIGLWVTFFYTTYCGLTVAQAGLIVVAARLLDAFFSPLIGLLPQLGIALVLLIGGREVIAGNLSLGEFTAFYTYLVILAAHQRTRNRDLSRKCTARHSWPAIDQRG